MHKITFSIEPETYHIEVENFQDELEKFQNKPENFQDELEIFQVEIENFQVLNGRQSRRFPHQIFDILDELKIKSRKVCLNFSLYLHGGLAV